MGMGLRIDGKCFFDNFFFEKRKKSCFLGKSHAGLEGLVGAWLFDEGKGNVTEDASGNGHDGDIRKAKWVKGKFGKALKFDGDGAVVILHSDDLTLGFFTITRWVKCENHGLGKPSL